MVSQRQLQAILISWLTLGALAPARADDSNPKLAGTYDYAGGDAEKKKLADTIDAVVGKMSVITRGVARKRLLQGNAPTREVTITLAPKKVTVARTDKPPTSAPDDGTKVRQQTTAGQQDVSFTVADGSIVQTMTGSASKSVNRFSLGPDGNTLTIKTQITSSHLPEAVSYSMTYKRR